MGPTGYLLPIQKIGQAAGDGEVGREALGLLGHSKTDLLVLCSYHLFYQMPQDLEHLCV